MTTPHRSKEISDLTSIEGYVIISEIKYNLLLIYVSHLMVTWLSTAAITIFPSDGFIDLSTITMSFSNIPISAMESPVTLLRNCWKDVE